MYRPGRERVAMTKANLEVTFSFKHPWMVQVYVWYLGFLIEIDWIDHDQAMDLIKVMINKQLLVTFKRQKA